MSAPTSSTSTPSAPPSPESRIINHMNADHHDSLVRYLEHLYAIPSRFARHAHLTQISKTHLTISISPSISFSKNDATYRVPFDPPLADLSQARTRLVEMDADARSALNRDEVTVKRYQPPSTPFQIAAVCTTLSVWVLFSSRRNLEPGNAGALFAPLANRFPAVFAFLASVQQRVLLGLAGIHVLECVGLDRTRLRKHSVPRGSLLWWTWIASNFVEGFTAPLRFDAMVRKEREKKAKAKH